MLKPLFITCFFIISASAIAQQDSTKKSPANNCDVITLKNGSFIYCKIKHLGKSTISYKDCNNPTEIITLPKDSASLVNYTDGTYEVIHPSHKEHWQDNFIGVSYGIGGPLFKFASAGPAPIGPYGPDDYNGYRGYKEALPGYVYNLLFYYHIKNQPYGLLANGGYQYNPFDVNAFTHAPPPNSVSDMPGSNYNSTVYGGDNVQSQSAGGYGACKLLVGISVCSKTGNTSLDFHVLGGLVYCLFPNIAYSINIPSILPHSTTDTLVNVSINKSTTLTSGLQFGLGARFYVTKGINFFLNMDLFLCTATFPISIQYNSNNPYSGISYPGAKNVSVTYSILNGTVGIAYSLNWK